MHDDGVPLAREVQQGVELRPGDILSRGFVGEGAIDGDLFELAIRVLVERADADIADALPIHGSTSFICQDKVYKVRGQMSRKRKWDAILTHMRRGG